MVGRANRGGAEPEAPNRGLLGQDAIENRRLGHLVVRIEFLLNRILRRPLFDALQRIDVVDGRRVPKDGWPQEENQFLPRRVALSRTKDVAENWDRAEPAVLLGVRILAEP